MLSRSGIRRYVTPLGFVLSSIVLGASSVVAQTGAPLDVRFAFKGNAPSFKTDGSPFAVLFNRLGQLLASVTGDRVGIALCAKGRRPQQNVRKCLFAFPRAAGVKAAYGLAYLDKMRRTLGAAVEDAGFAVGYVGNMQGCDFALTVRVPQPGPTADCASSPGTFDLTVSGDRRFAFVANEYARPAPGVAGVYGGVAVIPIAEPQSATAISVPGGDTIAGVTLSRDGKRLYVTAELASGDPICGTACNDPTGLGPGSPLVRGKVCLQIGKDNQPVYSLNGLLAVFDVAKLRQGLGQAALIRTIAAGCSPVRIVESRDGRTIWIATRGDNEVNAFDVRRLTAATDVEANMTLLGQADSGGTSPVGLALFGGGRFLAVVNSNRFSFPDGRSSVDVLDVRNPSAMKMTAAQYEIPRGTPGYPATSAFPRNVTIARDDSTHLVTVFSGNRILVMPTAITGATH